MSSSWLVYWPSNRVRHSVLPQSPAMHFSLIYQSQQARCMFFRGPCSFGLKKKRLWRRMPWPWNPHDRLATTSLARCRRKFAIGRACMGSLSRKGRVVLHIASKKFCYPSCSASSLTYIEIKKSLAWLEYYEFFPIVCTEVVRRPWQAQNDGFQQQDACAWRTQARKLVSVCLLFGWAALGTRPVNTLLISLMAHGPSDNISVMHKVSFAIVSYREVIFDAIAFTVPFKLQ